jgi:cell division protein ZapA
VSKSAPSKNSYDFDIAGLPYRLKTPHDPQTVHELVSFVDFKVKEALAATKSGSFQSAAVLAALNISEELILLKKKAHHDLDLLEEKAQRLADDIDETKVTKTNLSL